MNITFLSLLFITLNGTVFGEILCVTDDCKKLSKRIKESLDESVPPCQNFYKYVCGNYLKKTEIPIEQSYTNSYLEAEKNLDMQVNEILGDPINEHDIKPYKEAKHMYKLCMDEDKMEKEETDPLKNKIKAAGGWPVLGSWEKNKWTVLNTELSLDNLGLIGNSLFDISVDIDEKDNSKRILKIDQPELLVAREYLVGNQEDENVKNALGSEEKFMVDVAVILGAKEDTAKSEMKEVITFMINMARIMQRREEETKAEDMYNIVKLNELQQHADFLSWKELLRGLVPKNIIIDDNEPINVTDIQFLKQLGALLKQYDSKIIANYMIWYAIRDYLDTLTKNLRELKRRSDNWEGNGPPRWMECTADVYSRFPLAISSMYVKQFFSVDSKYAVKGYIRSLRMFVIERIDEKFSWLPEKTRRTAISKTYYMRDNVGFPDELMDDAKLMEYHDGLNLDQGTYFESILSWKMWSNKLKFNMLRDFYEKDDWRFHGAVVDGSGSFEFTENSMDFPAGYLQLPVYSDQVPKYINFAGIGQIAGNRFTLAFIDEGTQYDEKGNLNSWWDEDSRKTFKTKEDCFVEQYNGFTCSQTHKQVNGTKTLAMNMADNGGMRLAFELYSQTIAEQHEAKLPDLQEYTPGKLFWIVAANNWCTKVDDATLQQWIEDDVHAPPEYRVNGVAMNSEHFSSTFGCGESDKMNPSKKCTVW